jgi:hypothetical protein
VTVGALPNEPWKFVCATYTFPAHGLAAGGLTSISIHSLSVKVPARSASFHLPLQPVPCGLTTYQPDFGRPTIARSVQPPATRLRC